MVFYNYDNSHRKLATDIIPDIASSSIIGQGAFLKNMGVDYRMGTLLTNAEGDDDFAENLINGYERLVGNETGMGEIYKAMAIYNKKSKHALGGKDNQITGFYTP